MSVEYFKPQKKKMEEEEEEEGESEEIDIEGDTSEESDIEIPLEEIKPIDPSINFEIPEIVHHIFLFSLVSDILVFSRVSKRFRMVGTSDLLWSEIINRQSEYMPMNNRLTRNVFFYDLKQQRDNLYQKVVFKLNRGYKRAQKLEKRENQLEVAKKANKLFFHAKVCSVLLSLGCLLATCPPLSNILMGIIGLFQFYSEGRNGLGMVFPATVCCDTCTATCCTLFGWNSCCCVSILCTTCCAGTGYSCIPGCTIGTFLSFFMPCCCCDLLGCLANFLCTCCGGCCGLMCVPLCIYTAFMICSYSFMMSSCCAFLWGVLWLGRFYYLDELGFYEDNHIIFSSPASWCGIAAVLYVDMVLNG